MKETKYDLKLKSRTETGSTIYEFESADGIPSKDGFRDSELALADYTEPGRNENILVVQGNYGFLGVVLADQASGGRTVIGNTSDRAHQLTQINLDRNDVSNATTRKLGFYSEIDRNFDTVVYAPEGYEPVDVVKYRIGELVELLEAGDRILVAGEKTTGINRYSRYLKELPGETVKMAQDGSQRIYQYTATGDEEPEKPGIETAFTAEVDGVELEFNAREGLFSSGELDEATRLLIENTDLSGDQKLLDLASGYGPLGIFLSRIHSAEVTFTDDDGASIRYAQKNAESAGLKDSDIVHADCMDGFGSEEFDVIVSNPPTHQGEDITTEMFTESHDALREGGYLQIVYNSNMKFEDELAELFSEVEVVEEKDNFRVVRAIK